MLFRFYFPAFLDYRCFLLEPKESRAGSDTFQVVSLYMLIPQSCLSLFLFTATRAQTVVQEAQTTGASKHEVAEKTYANEREVKEYGG